MLVINKRGTERNIDESQFAEYKARGYEVVAKKEEAPTSRFANVKPPIADVAPATKSTRKLGR